MSLIPTVDKPTRVHNNSATLIDNIFTSKLDDEITSGNIISDISDHFTQFCITHTSLEKEKPDKLYTHDYSFFSEARFLNELSQTDWQSPSSENEANVDKLFSVFYNKLISKTIYKHAPLKPT